jgi:hypothetical protein
MKKYITILAVVSLTMLAAQAQLTYTETGGNISGSLNGVNFSDATWTITATADPSTATYYPAGGTIYAPVWSLFATPTITIISGSTTLSATLNGWDIESRNYFFNPPSRVGAIMFSDLTVDGRQGVELDYAAYITGTSANFNNLQSTGTFTGTSDFDLQTFATSAGNLIVNSDSAQPGTFNITSAAPIPEPSVLSLSVLGGLGLLVRFRRSK